MSTRYITNAAVILAGGFVVVASQAFDPAVTAWLALAIGIGVAVVTGLAQLERSRGLVQRSHDLVMAVVAALMIAFGAAFSGQDVKWLSFSLALGLVGLGFSGLTLHEIARWRAENHLVQARKPSQESADVSIGRSLTAA